MRVATLTCAYNEQRFIGPFLSHIPNWVETRLVLVSNQPWFGEKELADDTTQIAEQHGAQVVTDDWPTEAEQRNYGLDLLGDYDWVLVLDPDEFFDQENWEQLRILLERETEADAYVVHHQLTYWKSGYLADPPRDYLQLIAVRPYASFVENRVINLPFQVAPVYVHHFSWARTDNEVWRKISHYSHASDFDAQRWFTDVWQPWRPGIRDVHPTSPETLHNLIPAQLPAELEALNLWP